MNASPSRTCPKCGAALDSEAPEALCPKCLMDNAAWSQTIASPDDLEHTLRDTSAPPIPEALPPSSDFGGYRILRPLGRGGMGAVYEAEDLANGRRVALKVLSHRLDSEQARGRFLREGRLAASINHSHSVYVFGTDEIEGTPVISMEIVPGGTLQEKIVRDGPLPAPAAVDAILQIVSGLEAAQAIGILHRDVKPSNCFLDEQGAAKIGDFGLSISTEGREEADLTLQGTLLGTPAFSSPEQLRGDELNARSDMYSVGATLFYLLTGHAPFEEGNMVKLLSRVLEEAPPDPRAQCGTIPVGLAKIVLRCLAKTPADRYPSYADLARALKPYGSEAQSPATLALRLAAYSIDLLLLGTLGLLLQKLILGSVPDVMDEAALRAPSYVALMIGLVFGNALYFGILEATGGASLGKRLLRLRVVTLDRSTPTFGSAMVRIGILLLITSWPSWLEFLMNVRGLTLPDDTLSAFLIGGLLLGTIALLFSGARRRNGYAGLHELATGTRVIRVPANEPRPRLAPKPAAPGHPVDGAECIGPYHLIEEMGPSNDERWVVAYDTKLLRKVWVHCLTPGAAATPPVQRKLNRPGRLRWITGRRSGEDHWDAFEAPAGQPLSALIGGGHDWAAIRFWLLDLATELEAAGDDGSTPATLAFDRVWITEDGHAKLLDFPAPGAAPAAETFDTPAGFVAAIGRACLASAVPPPPLHTAALLQAAPATELGSLSTELRRSVSGAPSISRLRRLAITLTVSFIPFFVVVSGYLALAMLKSDWERHPELLELADITDTIDSQETLVPMMARMMNTEPDFTKRDNLERFIAHRYADLLNDPTIWSDPMTPLLIGPDGQRLAREAVAKYPVLTPEEIAAAEATGEAVLEDSAGNTFEIPQEAPLGFLMGSWLVYAALPSFLMALLFRRGLVLKVFGAAVVTKDGCQAGRLRALWRALLSWSPFGLGAAMTYPLVMLLGPVPATAMVVGSILALALLSHLQPGRSLQDRLAGTWLVPS